MSDFNDFGFSTVSADEYEAQQTKTVDTAKEVVSTATASIQPELEKIESLRAAKAVDGDIVGVDFIPAKDREKEKPYFIEVNSTPGLMGIESTFANSVIPSKLYKQTLKKEKGKLSITKEILRHYLNRENWKKKN